MLKPFITECKYKLQFRVYIIVYYSDTKEK